MAKPSTRSLIDLREWRQYGVNIVPATLGMTLVAVHPYALGVMISPLEEAFGWSRAEISAGPLVTSIVTLLLAVYGGKLVDRLGPRVVALFGVPFYAVALAMISFAGPSLVSWLALYALLAIALLSVYPSVWTAAIAQRFEANRGIAMAIVLSGTGIASAVVPYLAATLIEAHGWRGAYLGMGLLSFVAVFPLVALMFARDSLHRDRMERSISAQSPSNKLSSDTRRALLSPKFLYLAIAGVIYSLGATGLGINAVPILMEEGFSLLAAAEVAGFIGLGTITGRIIGGLLLDHIDGRFVAIGCALGAMSAAVILLTTDQSALAASIACLLLGFTAGAEYDACAYLTSRHFSQRHFAALFGLLGGLFGFTAGVAPFIANALYGVFGNYDGILMAVVPLFCVASALFLLLGKYPESVPE